MIRPITVAARLSSEWCCAHRLKAATTQRSRNHPSAFLAMAVLEQGCADKCQRNRVRTGGARKHVFQTAAPPKSSAPAARPLRPGEPAEEGRAQPAEHDPAGDMCEG